MVLASAFLYAMAPGAQAHDVLVAMSPAVDSLVMVAPTSVVLTFDAPVQDIGDAVIVTAPSGARVQSGPPQVLDNTVTAPLSPLSEPGRYVVAFRIVSADGHPVAKQVGFDYLVRGTASDSPLAGGDGDALAGDQPPWALLAGIGVLLVGAGVLAAMRARRGPSG